MKSEYERFRVWLDEKGATEIEIIDISSLSTEMDAFVIATVANDRMAKAAAEYVEEQSELSGMVLRGREGKDVGKWILLDYGEVVVHIFQQDERKLYNLEKLWADTVAIERK